MGAEHYGEERQETAEATAESIVREELRRHRWQEADLRRRIKGDRVKIAIATRMRSETTMTVKWIAGRLQMGSCGYTNHLLHLNQKNKRQQRSI